MSIRPPGDLHSLWSSHTFLGEDPDSSDAQRSVSSKFSDKTNDYFICICLNKHESVHKHSDVILLIFFYHSIRVAVFLLL